MTPWQAVHERLMQTLPVRTHRRPADPVPRHEGEQPVRNKIACRFRRASIRAWLTQGVDKGVMAERLGITVRAVENHLHAIAEETSG
jgi:DNA-binding NarL/FixJ family response regulator